MTRRAAAPALNAAAQLFFELWMQERARFATIANELGLSPMQAGTLFRLEPGEPLPMSALAGHMACDPSNVTTIVDNLEALGLVERRASDLDRRVKNIAVTAAGGRFRAKLVDRLREPAPWMRELSSSEQRAFRDVLRRCLDLAVAKAQAEEPLSSRTRGSSLRGSLTSRLTG
ncbi:MAG TPA: MarR family winged helix-turn-helix transcriptional regulator [Planctomycetota bacterium]|nr:MarR family winged helix-turn-helix transcriptional regulator [Planctomycetota bacterium]